MGIESFFITILPENTNFCFSNNIRSVQGNNNSFELNWEEILKENKLSIIKKEEYIIIDNCIEMDLRNGTESTYIVLRGCFSCFDESVKKMGYIIECISNLDTVKIKIDILGEIFYFDKSRFNNIIYNAYNKKYKAFKHNYGDVILSVSPSGFFKEYRKYKSPIRRFIKKIFQ